MMVTVNVMDATHGRKGGGERVLPVGLCWMMLRRPGVEGEYMDYDGDNGILFGG